MGRFLKEYWVWILAPVIVVGLVFLIALLILGEGDSPFAYALF
jgi:hypothetical protein